jgi:hypothetical protein
MIEFRMDVNRNEMDQPDGAGQETMSGTGTRYGNTEVLTLLENGASTTDRGNSFAYVYGSLLDLV